jgi:hypothetical protein
MKHQLMQDLYTCQADEGNDIIVHLKKIKQIWECISVVCQDKLPMRPDQLKEFVVHMLPMLWNVFTTPYLKEAVLMDSVSGFGPVWFLDQKLLNHNCNWLS